MTAISALRAKAAEKFGGYPVEFDSGKSVRLKSLMELNEAELAAFHKAQTALVSERKDSEDFAVLEEVRREFAACLITVADDKALASKELGKESLGVLMAVFEAYTETVKSASKSEATS